MKRARYIKSAILASALGMFIALPVTASADSMRKDHRFKSDNVYSQTQTFPPERVQIMQVAAVEISPSQAKSIALRHVQGSEFLDIKLVRGNTYIVLLMKNGRRIDVRINAMTGRVVS